MKVSDKSNKKSTPPCKIDYTFSQLFLFNNCVAIFILFFLFNGAFSSLDCVTLNVVTITLVDSVWTDVAVVGIWALSLHERVNKEKEILSHDKFKPGALGVSGPTVTVWCYVCIWH
jgi:hypothetical protein